jgi:hypothetical protein
VTVLVPAYGPPGDLILHANVDHLYPACPLLLRLCRGRLPRRLGGVFCLILDGEAVEEYDDPAGVDPEGTDICGLCRRWWRARKRRRARAEYAERHREWVAGVRDLRQALDTSGMVEPIWSALLQIAEGLAAGAAELDRVEREVAAAAGEEKHG